MTTDNHETINCYRTYVNENYLRANFGSCNDDEVFILHVDMQDSQTEPATVPVANPERFMSWQSNIEFASTLPNFERAPTASTVRQSYDSDSDLDSPNIRTTSLDTQVFRVRSLTSEYEGNPSPLILPSAGPPSQEYESEYQ